MTAEKKINRRWPRWRLEGDPPELWKHVNVGPRPGYPTGNHDLLRKTRWGWKIKCLGNPVTVPCCSDGGIFRKHIYLKNGICRRCAWPKSRERDLAGYFKGDLS